MPARAPVDILSELVDDATVEPTLPPLPCAAAVMDGVPDCEVPLGLPGLTEGDLDAVKLPALQGLTEGDLDAVKLPALPGLTEGDGVTAAEIAKLLMPPTV